MSDPNPAIQRIAIAAHPQVPQSANEAAQIAAFLREHGVETAHGLLYDDDLRQRIQNGEFELLIAVGGDGTILRAGHLAAPAGVPIMGINMGRFGFLTEVRLNEWRQILPRLLSGSYWIERRMMLCAKLWREDELLGSWEVLNEVVVTRGQLVRPVHLETYVDGRFLTTYVADALIASTPTGSTAYALAAGGPILPPEVRNILLVAVAPHLSIDRAIVLSEGATVGIIVHTDHQAALSVDGQVPVDMLDGDRVDARASEHTIQFIRFQDPGYFYRNLTIHMNRNPAAIGNQNDVTRS